ncbi:YceI family protein [Roseivirga sp. E12]|uniref:YceI family protein n=1 Tax=Roseivirga sp. E12 TaxID=2819237 RepID=UPI001ABD37F3|nr:YceI family protein [Roseivirga sp. E12]MBO3700238.1 YceI family protein [Roseivirga sp. E12]
MLKYIFCLLFCGILIQSNAQNFSIDNEHTAVTSKVQRFGTVDVVGRFNKVEGTITYDSDPSKISADVTISVDSYTSNSLGGEQAVKGPAFLDSSNYPHIKFKSQSVTKQGGQFIMKGELTIHGTTNTVELPFKLVEPAKGPRGFNTMAVFATLIINRQDYGVTFSRKLPNGNPLIGNEVKIELNVLAIEE